MGPPVCSPSLPEQAQMALRVPGNSGKQLQALKNQQHRNEEAQGGPWSRHVLGRAWLQVCLQGPPKEALSASPPRVNLPKQHTHQCQSGLQGLCPSLGHLRGGPSRPCSKSRWTCGHGRGWQGEQPAVKDSGRRGGLVWQER